MADMIDHVGVYEGVLVPAPYADPASRTIRTHASARALDIIGLQWMTPFSDCSPLVPLYAATLHDIQYSMRANVTTLLTSTSRAAQRRIAIQ